MDRSTQVANAYPMTHTRPCATVIIDTYNQASYIDEAVTSVLTQARLPGPLEIIIIDDGSTDETPSRLGRYRDQAHIILKGNGGQASAFNVGLARSSSDTIMLLDGDDYWYPEKVSQVLAVFAQHPEASIVIHALEGQPHPSLHGKFIDAPEDLLQYRGYPTSALSLRYSLIARLLPVPWDLWFCADAYLAYLAPFCGEVVTIGEPLGVQRIHDDNLFEFVDGSVEKQVRRHQVAKAVDRQVSGWLVSNGFDTNSYPIRQYLRGLELYIDELSFAFRSPGRMRWMRHNALRALVERRHQPRGHVVLHTLTAILAGALGYRRTLRARDLYHRSHLHSGTKGQGPASKAGRP